MVRLVLLSNSVLVLMAITWQDRRWSTSKISQSKTSATEEVSAVRFQFCVEPEELDLMLPSLMVSEVSLAHKGG